MGDGALNQDRGKQNSLSNNCNILDLGSEVRLPESKILVLSIAR